MLITRGLSGSGALEGNRNRESYVSKSCIHKIFYTRLVRFSMRSISRGVAFVVVRGGILFKQEKWNGL